MVTRSVFSSEQKCDTEGEYLTTCMAAGRQRVDTRGGGGGGGGRKSRSEALETLSSDVYWKLEHWQRRMNTALLVVMKYGRALPCARLSSIHLISKHMTTLHNLCIASNSKLKATQDWYQDHYLHT